MRLIRNGVAAVFLLGALLVNLAPADELADALSSIRAVGPKGAGVREAQVAWKTVSAADAAKLPAILAAMDGANPLAENYVRAAVDAIAERELAAGGKLDAASLEAFVMDAGRNGRARRLAYEWLVKVDPSAPERIVPKMLSDPALELRRDAVAQVLDAAKKQRDGGEREKAIDSYRLAFASARAVDQIQAAAAALREMKESVDLPRHFGFVMKWRIIGPFDNTGQKAFDRAYPPESQFDLEAKYEGKTGPVGWIEYTTSDDYGLVDLTKALDKHKGAVAYAAAEFHAPAPREIDLRLGSINANKLWLNGELLGGREVYHSGMEIDQYVYRAKLKAGRNLILVKVLQNEQTDDWAQAWQFQLRVCDRIGTAVLSEEGAREEGVRRGE